MKGVNMDKRDLLTEVMIAGILILLVVMVIGLTVTGELFGN